MSAPPFMQLYVADYLGDTRHLTTEQHGAYLLLLMCMWRSGGELVNEAAKLARLTGCTASRWARISADVLELFEIRDGMLSHTRITVELEKALEKQNQRAASGSLGGNAKARKTKETNLAKASDLLKHSLEPEPDTEEVSEAKASSPRMAAARSNGFDLFWAAYPNKVGKRDAEKRYVAALKRVTGPDPPGQILDGVARAKTSRKWLDGIIPNPATWLNQDRWEDQPSEIIPLQPRQPHERFDPDAKRARREANSARSDEGAYLAARQRFQP